MRLMIHPSKGIRSFLCLLYFPLAALGQPNPPDTIFLSSAITNAKALFTHLVGVQSHLYNGVQYKERNPLPNEVGNPYFLSDDLLEGIICYDGEVHENVPLLYDVVNQKVIIEHPISGAKLELINEKIKYFSVNNHLFVSLYGEAIRNSPVRSGFHDLLYDGKVKFFVKWQRKLDEKIVSQEKRAEFIENNRYYIYKNGLFFPVKTKSSVLNVLGNRKTELRKYIRKNKINFRKDRELAIAKVVLFYDESDK